MPLPPRAGRRVSELQAPPPGRLPAVTGGGRQGMWRVREGTAERKTRSACDRCWQTASSSRTRRTTWVHVRTQRSPCPLVEEVCLRHGVRGRDGGIVGRIHEVALRVDGATTRTADLDDEVLTLHLVGYATPEIGRANVERNRTVAEADVEVALTSGDVQRIAEAWYHWPGRCCGSTIRRVSRVSEFEGAWVAFFPGSLGRERVLAILVSELLRWERAADASDRLRVQLNVGGSTPARSDAHGPDRVGGEPVRQGVGRARQDSRGRRPHCRGRFSRRARSADRGAGCPRTLLSGSDSVVAVADLRRTVCSTGGPLSVLIVQHLVSR